MNGHKEMITFRKGDRQATKELWSIIDSGWSIVSAVYQSAKGRFVIKLSNDSWPAITVTCSGCGTKWPARELSFDPSPGGLCYCSTCKW